MDDLSPKLEHNENTEHNKKTIINPLLIRNLPAGSVVLVAFQDPAALNKKRVQFSQVYNEPMSVWMKELSEFTKRHVELITVPFDIVKQGQPYMAEIFGCQQEIGYYAGEKSLDIIEASSIVSKPFKSWSAWLEGSKWANNLK